MKPNQLGVKIIRIVLGVILLVFSLNGFFQFLPMPPLHDPASEFFGALYQSGYMIPLLYGAELIIALLLLFNRFVPLALLLFLPLAVNILFFHLFLAPAGGAAGYLTVILEAILLIAYKEDYRDLLRPKANK